MHRLFAIRRSAPRRGGVLILVMICLLGITVLSGTLLRLAVVQQRQGRMQQRQLQAEWLAAAALDRAAVKLTADPAWLGDVWTLDETVLETAGTAVVRVTSAKGDASVREITATASVAQPDLPPVRVTRRRNFTAPAAAGGTP
jgi:type II secretory pathway component PulK